MSEKLEGADDGPQGLSSGWELTSKLGSDFLDFSMFFFSLKFVKNFQILTLPIAFLTVNLNFMQLGFALLGHQVNVLNMISRVFLLCCYFIEVAQHEVLTYNLI